MKVKKISLFFLIVFSVILISCSVRAEASGSDGFVGTNGSRFVYSNGKEYKIRGMNFSNNSYEKWLDITKIENDHNEESYKELSSMGFNTIRFYLNYNMFESDEAPGNYYPLGFQKIDENIELAKKYGMKLLFNMHYPQGGYQSRGGGNALWTGEKSASNQERLANLWAEFARRYADEPAVLGYGLVNEPYIPGSDYDSALALWTALSQKITDKIRKYDKNHIIFVERVFKIKNYATGIDVNYGADQGYPDLKDDNFAYEIHFYEPGAFSNQGMPWSESYKNTSYTWPNEDVVIEIYNRKALDNAKVSRQYSGPFKTGADWQELQTDFYRAENEKDTVANFKLICSRLGSVAQEGILYLDYLELIEKSGGEGKVIYREDFESSKGLFDGTKNLSILQKSASELTALGITDCNGALEVKQQVEEGKSDYAQVVDEANRGIIKSGRQYSIKIRFIVNVADDAQNTNITLQFIPCTANVRHHDKDFLDANIKAYANVAEERQIPFYVGEFGLYKYAFFETNTSNPAEKGAGQYIRELISVFNKYNLAYSYHCYHEDGFGLYCDGWTSVPSDSPAKEGRIEELYQALKDSVK